MGTPSGVHPGGNTAVQAAADAMQDYVLDDGSIVSAPGAAGGDMTATAAHHAEAGGPLGGASSGSGIGGKMKKSGSGFFKSLRRNRSSGSLADDGTSVAGASEGGMTADSVASDVDAPSTKKKGVSKLLGSFSRKHKKGSSASLAQDAEAEQGAEIEAYDEEQMMAKRSGLVGRMARASRQRRASRDSSVYSAGDDDVAFGQADQGLHHDDDAPAAGAYHLGANEIEEDESDRHPHHGATMASHEVVDAGASDNSGDAPLPPGHGGAFAAAAEQEEAAAAAAGEIEPEEEKKAESKGIFGGLLGRARSGGLSGILGKPKDEATLAAEAEAAEAAAIAAAEAEAAAAAAAAEAAARAEPTKEPPVRKFPRGFMWGTATSAFQIEGAYQDEGKGLSIWDAFCHTPGKISGNATGDISTCHFYRFKEDVALMRSMGVKYYRMSIAWSRIFPNGKGKVNERGVAFYNRLINELIANKIMPVVTLYHWDLPLALQVEEDGWVNPKVVDHFVKYAKLCFSRFGDRVKYWLTLNEPWCAAVLGHDSGGQHAPGRTVDPSREVYKVAHHMLIAHARTYQMYQRVFKRKQRGKIGIALNGDWYEPKPAADVGEQRRNERAAERALEFTIGWFARPIYQGDYPSLMRERCGNRLPRFTPEQRAMLVGSTDFFGLNHYSSHLCEQPAWYKEMSPEDEEEERDREGKLMKLGAQLERMMTAVTGARNENEIQEGEAEPEPQPDPAKVQLVDDDDDVPEDPFIESTGYWQDISVDQSDDDVWKTTDMGWGVHPEGMRKMLNYIQKEYHPRGGIIITENGCAVEEPDVDEALKDIERAVYLKRYLTEVHKALLHDDVDVRGYFVWSLLDNFEWGYGYTKKFGLHYVDMQTLERIPKMSANWYAEVVKKNRLDLM